MKRIENFLKSLDSVSIPFYIGMTMLGLFLVEVVLKSL